MMKQTMLPALCLSTFLAASCHVVGQPDSSQDKPVQKRVADRLFPSVFQAWNPADNVDTGDKLVTAARHDLIFHGAGFFGLRWDHRIPGLATGFTGESIERGLTKRRSLLSLNPNVILLMEIRYRDAHRNHLPEDHEWWKRDRDGAPVMGWAEGRYIQLDFSNPEYRDHVARKAAAAIKSGVVDGIMLDWWRDDADRIALVKAIRDRIGEKALILANANDRKTPETAAFINGYFMECYRSATPQDWQRISETLIWAESHLREPRINCLESWYHTSRNDRHLMRAVTTLSLTQSNGYCLFSDPNSLPAPDHLHDWYPFWDADLGKPLSPGQRQGDGSFKREFSKGTALYNPMGNKPVTVVFGEERKSVATGRMAKEHPVAPVDGDIFLSNTGGTDRKH